MAHTVAFICFKTCIVYILQSALRLKPYFTDAYNNMASALVQKGLIPEAMDCYMQVGAASTLLPQHVYNSSSVYGGTDKSRLTE